MSVSTSYISLIVGLCLKAAIAIQEVNMSSLCDVFVLSL